MSTVRGYRLVKRKWLQTAFDGEGARLYGGRWNSKGKAGVYLPADSLPEDWMEEPAPASTAEIGDSWLESQSSLALVVPSVVVPRETNYLINPSHSYFQALADSAREVSFTPDKRL